MTHNSKEGLMESTKSKKAWVIAAYHSCVLNKNHAKRIRNYLLENNWEIVNNHSDAQLVIYSGCGSSQVYEKKSIADIEYLKKEISLKNNEAKLVLSGCLPTINEISEETLNKKTMKEIHQGHESPILDMSKLDKLINAKTPFRKIPHPNKMDIDDFIIEQKFSHSSIPDIQTKIKAKIYGGLQNLFSKLEKINPLNKKERKNFASPFELIESGYDMLMVGTGCRNSCTYCVKRFSRGKSKSVPIKNIMAQLKKRISQGQKKFFVTCDDLGSWGTDLRSHWTTMLKEIVSLDEDYEIALLNLGVYDMVSSERELKQVIETGKVNFIAVKMQHVNRSILRRMNRRYTDPEKIQSIFNWMEKFKIQINCHFILGFPGETEEEFSEIMDFVSKIKNKYFFARPSCFSPRPGTAAYQRYKHMELEMEIATNRMETLQRTNNLRNRSNGFLRNKWSISATLSLKMHDLILQKLNIDNEMIFLDGQEESTLDDVIKHDMELSNLK